MIGAAVDLPPALAASSEELETQNLPVDAGAEDGSATPAREAATLLVLEGTSSRLIPLPEDGALIIGRGLQADVVLAHHSVSRAHARLTVEAGTARLTDLGSHNGTLLNGQRMQHTQALETNDVITIAGARLVYQSAHEPRRLEIADQRAHVADPAMLALYALVERLAGSDLPVLVHGETGAGKELVTLALHAWSKRKTGPVLALNCAAVPENLFESELFGYEEGAFSGAKGARPGLFERAAGGTVVLDEVGELPPAVQAKLLRVLETKRVARLGQLGVERDVDVRIVAATNRDLPAEVKAGRFRGDLYFRLGAASVWVPPLRDRPRDIPMLAEAFLAEACARAGRPPLRLSPEVLRLFTAHRWPGNVRELKNLLEYAAATVLEPVLEPFHVLPRLDAWRSDGPSPAPAEAAALAPADAAPAFRPIDDEVRELERARMAAALRATGGHQKRAAELIGMPLRTFVAKLKQYDLRGEGHRPSR